MSRAPSTRGTYQASVFFEGLKAVVNEDGILRIDVDVNDNRAIVKTLKEYGLSMSQVEEVTNLVFDLTVVNHMVGHIKR